MECKNNIIIIMPVSLTSTWATCDTLGLFVGDRLGGHGGILVLLLFQRIDALLSHLFVVFSQLGAIV